MRPGHPGNYACGKSKDRGMHKWTRTGESAECMFCGLTVTGEDAASVFRGARTPIGELSSENDILTLWKEREKDRADAALAKLDQPTDGRVA